MPGEQPFGGVPSHHSPSRLGPLAGFARRASWWNYSPIEDEEIRSVIHHLKVLAHHREDPRIEKMLVGAIPAIQGALWDQELDG